MRVEGVLKFDDNDFYSVAKLEKILLKNKNLVGKISNDVLITFDTLKWINNHLIFTGTNNDNL